MKLQKPKGTADLLPAETAKWQYIEEIARGVFNDYNFKEIRTPMFESYELFSRATGETSDIVTKEMYDFEDKGGRHIALRPEGTASAVRAYIENKLYAPEVVKPVKLWYDAPMFRYERPQSGRLRQFHQFGVECLGLKNSAVDVEIIAMADTLFRQLGISGVKLSLNTLGDMESRKAYRQALIDYLTPFENQLSEDSRRRLNENPLRVLDSKEAEDIAIVKNAPAILDYLNETSKAYFEEVKALLEALNIEYTIDSNMVRGLDYYNDTIFEFIVNFDGKELTVCGGGRYDGLVEYFDGPATPAFGFGLGIERLLMIAEKQEINFIPEETLDVYIAVMGEKANLEATKLAESLREQAFKVERDFSNRKLGAQFKTAEKLGAELIITLGEDEVRTGQIKVKHNQTRKQVETTLKAVHESFAPIFEEIYADEIN
ncbi:MAG: histidine--tRNA ligase [Lactococcus lactis]|uniref:Histidine--tRNA ligase n=4 Tax=Lactococcus lactis subsp. cremoris TaxID=1359 RepID=SYH_LACLS|nr:histidine--tRNA ligase [Lactococcus cremoris]Q02WI8.1 RecName: Full=Histidine--tRNA ligase; AltName: Full=Histidyl-tRNA synthetase; Short=HisRS [Lactococcus cremoris subsp. cremoris SK11]EQC56381.1 histidyl-tRNA synthase [Lactococcus cremoris subsp. cremoris TIFN6]EQC83516.1 histidyl-tRNA synthase [Lactococcus cremoris subsp. cremoris TIFN7]EQC96026.1 histidyl-tRNA synthase [Lactococcus cremoris subsp. cremoris TIFN3]MDU1525291.1 histidine--tRNA ligase [Lactococcus lactis]ABJ73684.1 histid